MCVHIYIQDSLDNIYVATYVHSISIVAIIIVCITDFIRLKTHYHTILHLMPDEYELSVGKLVNYINDDQIGAILSSSNASVDNKLILDCLIERISCKEELLICVINWIKPNGLIGHPYYICVYIIMLCTLF